MKGIQKVFFLIFLTSLHACFDDEKKVFEVFESPGHRYKLHVLYTDPPIFGPHKMYFVLEDTKTNTKKDEGFRELDNDGANLTNANLRVQWLDNQHIQILLNGEQQQEDTLMIDLN